MERFPSNMEEYGNTSAASIPILLDEMNRSGKLERGQKLVMSGFGAGLTWGACVFEVVNFRCVGLHINQMENQKEKKSKC